MIITHSPLSRYFASTNKGGGYIKINQEISTLIEFYNVMYCNQPNKFVSNTTSVVFNTSTNVLNISVN